MKLGIMQPYFIPYIGYWQLMNAVDKYVIYDDVNYINRGGVNRNRILLNGRPGYITLPLAGASQNKKINEIEIDDTSRLLKKNLKTIECTYRRAPYYQETMCLAEKIFNNRKKNLVSYIEDSFCLICNYLDIRTEFIRSSSINKNCSLKGQEKILEICTLLGADEYYNPIGGKKLYCPSEFQKRGVKLQFLASNPVVYKQFDNEFQQELSILDVMMFNSKEEIKGFLKQYTL